MSAAALGFGVLWGAQELGSTSHVDPVVEI